MANTEGPSLEAFNDMGVSAPLPGDNSTFDPPHETQAEVPVHAAPEVPAVEDGEPTNPREVIEQFVGDLDKTEKKKTFAELRRSSEQQIAADRAQAKAELERVQGLAELGQLIEDNPAFRERLTQAYNETVGGADAASQYSPPARQPVAPQGNEEIVRLTQRLSAAERTLMQNQMNSATQIVQGRHHINEEGMAAVVLHAVRTGHIKPGMTQQDFERELEDSRKVVYFDQQKSAGKTELLNRVAEKNRAVTAQGAAGEGIPRKPYDTTGKTFAEIRRDAKLAGSKGL